MKKKKLISRSMFMVAAILAVLAFIAGPVSAAKTKKPNILVIMADDIGYWNVSYNNRGMMGYKTPNIDRIADEGMIFTDYYGEQSCTAGRSAFITGQSPVRTGLTKVGMPGAKLGIQSEDPTLAELLKPMGYTTGQFGKNHLGDRDEFLPTAHGFDEFFGNLYHLNAEEEPEHVDYSKDPEFRKKFGPRGVIKATAGGKIKDTGPLTRKRMETVDEEFLAATKDFIQRAKKADKPFFVWFNPSRMHFYTHIKPEHQGISGQNFYADGMVEHDMHVGELLKLLDDLKIADNTIVIYTTDNGPHYNEWPDGGVAPFLGLRYNAWKAVFMEQRAHRFDVWRDPFVTLRAPKLFNLRRDPFERADTDSNMYNRWWCEHAFVFIPAQAMSLQFANTFRTFPPRQGAAKFNVEATMDILKELTPATAN